MSKHTTSYIISVIKYKFTKSTSEKNVCYRCGRDGHFSNDCYASKHISGKCLN